VPLQPEFIAPQDGSDKQDCESRAGRRWLAAHGPTFAHLNPIYLGDDLYSCQPICEAVLAVGGHFLFVCKLQSHPTLGEYLSGVELDTHVEIAKRGKQRSRYTYRFMCDLPLRDGKDALRVNWLSIEIADTAGKVSYRNSFITDLPVDRTNVVAMAACGRARWKVENETFNTLKTKGYNLEHNFGHGSNHLAAVLVTLNLLVFAWPYHRRSCRRGVAESENQTSHPRRILQPSARYHGLRRLFILEAPHGDTRLRQTAIQTAIGQNENCCLDRARLAQIFVVQ
jgi:hypothetical protein